MNKTVMPSIGKVSVLVLILLPLGHIMFPPSLVVTISVTLVIVDQDIISLPSILMTHCGMVRGVALLVAAVSSTPLHGSASFYLNLPQMTWR